MSEQAVCKIGDEHCYKIVAICKQRWLTLLDKQSRAARICEMAAMTSLNQPIYWHKYQPIDNLPADAIGVSGIRNNEF